MGRAQREKGANGEREVAAILRQAGFDVDRVPNSGGLRVRGDLTGVDGYHLEVKRQEVARFPLWLRQANGECDGKVPVVVWRPNRGQWTATLPLDALAELLAVARLRT